MESIKEISKKIGNGIKYFCDKVFGYHVEQLVVGDSISQLVVASNKKGDVGTLSILVDGLNNADKNGAIMNKKIEDSVSLNASYNGVNNEQVENLNNSNRIIGDPSAIDENKIPNNNGKNKAPEKGDR